MITRSTASIATRGNLRPGGIARLGVNCEEAGLAGITWSAAKGEGRGYGLLSKADKKSSLACNQTGVKQTAYIQNEYILFVLLFGHRHAR